MVETKTKIGTTKKMGYKDRKELLPIIVAFMYCSSSLTTTDWATEVDSSSNLNYTALPLT